MRTRSIPSMLAGLCSLLLFGCSGSPDAAAPPLAVTGPSFASAGAGPPLSGSGTGAITSLVITSNRMAGGNVIQERDITGILSGALQGTFTEHTRGVVHATGLITFQATFVFTGTVAGCEGEGSLTAALSGTGQTGVPVTDAALRIIDQASGSLHVAGTGTMHQEGPLATYQVRYVCR